jgi:hypothetical protein
MKAYRVLAQVDARNIASFGLGISDFAVLEILLHKGPLPVKYDRTKNHAHQWFDHLDVIVQPSEGYSLPAVVAYAPADSEAAVKRAKELAVSTAEFW